MKIINYKLENRFVFRLIKLLSVRLTRLSISFVPPGRMTPGVLPQVIFPVKRTAALYASVPLLARMHHLVQR